MTTKVKDPMTESDAILSLTLAEAIAKADAVIGMQVRIKDRNNALMEYKAIYGTPDGYKDVLAAGSGLQLSVVSANDIDLKWFGATGDGLTNDSAAIASAESFIENGNINISSGKYIGKMVSSKKFALGLTGQGENSTTIITPLNSDSAFSVSAGDEFRFVSIENVSFYQDGWDMMNQGTGVGVDLTAGITSVNYTLRNVSVNYFNIGIESSPNAFSNQWDNVRASFCNQSFRFVGSGQLINHTINNAYSSQPVVNGVFISGCKDFVFNAYNSGSSGAPHVNIAGGSFGIIFNSPNFEQDLGVIAANSECVRCQSNSESTFNYPTFASPASSDSTAYLFRVIETAVVYINNPKIISSDANIQHILVQDDAVVYLNDPKGVFDKSKITILGNGKLIIINSEANWSSSGSIASHPSGSPITTGLSTIPVDYQVEIDPSVSGDAIIAIQPQITQLGTGTLKIRYVNIATGAENFSSWPIRWRAR